MSRLLAIRRRETGAEVSVEHEGREFILWRAGWQAPDEPTAGDSEELRQWAAPIIQARLDDEQAQSDADAADEAAIDLAGFIQWVRDHRRDPEVRVALKPLARRYREEVG